MCSTNVHSFKSEGDNFKKINVQTETKKGMSKDINHVEVNTLGEIIDGTFFPRASVRLRALLRAIYHSLFSS
jgi:hypothetical protein